MTTHHRFSDRPRRDRIRVLAAPLVAPLLVFASLEAGGQAQPPRDPRQAPPVPIRDTGGRAPQPVGTGAIAGVVTVSGMPARRARVTLNSTGAPTGPDVRLGAQTAATDDAGRFTFENLPAGRYTLSASKPGHIGGSYGQRLPGRPGTPIHLGDGQKLQASFQIWRGGVITGTLLDEHGEAIPNTPVRVLRYVTQNGVRMLQQSGNAQTDDRGVYRVFNLQPGDYLVSAVPRQSSTQSVMAQQREALAALQQARAAAGANAEQVAALGQRLEFMASGMESSDEPSTGYAPVYYPGTTNPASAVAVSVGASEEKSGIDFQYVVVPVSRIEGVVTVAGSEALPGNVQVSLVNAGFDVPGISPGNTRVDQRGTFRFSNVPPGQYTVFARATIAAGREGGAGGRGFGPGRGGFAAGGRGEAQAARGRINGPDVDPIRMWGTASVTIDGRSEANVVVTLQQGVPVSGRVVFDGASPPPADQTAMRVLLTPVATGEREIATGATGRVSADGRFTIASVVPGRYRLSASGGGQSWVMAAATLDGQDAFDFPVEVKGAISGATVTLVDRPSEVSGTITDTQSQPVVDYTLVLYPSDHRYRAPLSRRILSARPSTDGHFSFRNVPAGDYRLVPVLDPEPGAVYDPAYLQQLDSGAIAVSVAQGEKKQQNLQIRAGG
jgi:hypothetical protein